MKDTTNTTSGTIGQDFVQGEKVMVRRLGDGNEYRAEIAGVAVGSEPAKIMIIKIVDPFKDYPFTHCSMPEACIDKESW